MLRTCNLVASLVLIVAQYDNSNLFCYILENYKQKHNNEHDL